MDKLPQTLAGYCVDSLCMVNRQVTTLQTAPMPISRLSGTQPQALGGRDASWSFWCKVHRNKLIGTGCVGDGRRPRSGGSAKGRSEHSTESLNSPVWRNQSYIHIHASNSRVKRAGL